MGKLYLSLGRLGDVINILPLLYQEHAEGNHCSLMVSKDYASVLDGCTYLDPIIFDGHYGEVGRAFHQAEKVNGEIVVAQTNGPIQDIEKYAYRRAGQKTHETDSFVKEQYKLAGKLKLWRDQPPLVFDRRNPERELQLRMAADALPKHTGVKKKRLLLHLGGNTAPFPYERLLRELLEYKLKGWRAIDLETVKAEKFYDFLGLYENADALIACDSAPLHLAQAVPTLPVFALINDRPNYWHGAPWRPNHVWHCRYHDFADRWEELFETLETLPKPKPRNLGSRKIIHLWLRKDDSKENAAARNAAFQTWQMAYATDDAWDPCPIEPGAVGKDTFLIGDEDRYPFLRSALQLGMMKANPDDIMVVTRSSTCFGTNVTPDLLAASPCYAHRRTSSGFHHPAVDLLAGPRSFWDSIWNEIPDLIMGRDRLWGQVLGKIFRLHGAKDLSGIVHTSALDSQWQGWRYTTPNLWPKRLKHNHDLTEKFNAEHGTGETYPAIKEQAKIFHLNPASLPPHAYNPSIIEGTDGLWLAYRYHTGDTLSTRLGIAALEEHGNARRTATLKLPGQSVEDPKFFRYQGQRWLSWVESDFEGQSDPKSVVKIGRLTDKWEVDCILQPNFCKNDWRAMEKNWVFFEAEGRLFAVYTTYPAHVVLEVYAETHHTAPGARWAWGDFKGDVMVGEHEGCFLRFFHSTLDNESFPYPRRYYVGALLMEKTPPFNIKKVSREPILYGSTNDELTTDQRERIPQYKGRVVFPGGALKINDGWLLAVGVNDSACKLVKITDLKL